MILKRRGIAAAAVLAAAVLWLLFHHDGWRASRLRREGMGANGVVTGLDAGRRVVRYAFTAEERLYTGEGSAGYGNPEFPELSVGDRLIVFYLPSDPGVSMLGDPKERLRDQNRILAWGLFVAVLAFGWAFRRELRSGAL